MQPKAEHLFSTISTQNNHSISHGFIVIF